MKYLGFDQEVIQLIIKLQVSIHCNISSLLATQQ
jgi:hypothetical protein